MLTQVAHALADSVPRLRRAAVEFVRAENGSSELEEAVGLAVSEACTNAVVHAYGDSESGGEIQLTATREGDALVVTVSDDGRGMGPRPDSPGLGLGLPLIAICTRSLEVRRGPHGGTEIRMTFAFAPEAASERRAGAHR
jgi:anti-sigma regulatory factor (Ser/Thr protein kinase)